jgi:hypothetical protein
MGAAPICTQLAVVAMHTEVQMRAGAGSVHTDATTMESASRPGCCDPWLLSLCDGRRRCLSPRPLAWPATGMTVCPDGYSNPTLSAWMTGMEGENLVLRDDVWKLETGCRQSPLSLQFQFVAGPAEALRRAGALAPFC